MIRRLALLLAILFWPLAAFAQTNGRPNQVLTRIAFGSCAHQEREQPIWEAVRNYKPELFLFAGDNVYGDYINGKPVTDEARLIESLTLAYNRAAMNPQLRELRESVPHLATWDDHDFGKNDSGVDFAHKDEAQKLFASFWKLPQSDPRRSRPGVYHAVTFGPEGQRVQVILLDTRYFRSALKITDQRGAPGRERFLPDDSPEKTMLGAAQWEWLEARLKEPADLRLIVSSIQVVADGHGWERWGNFPRERQKLYDLLSATKAGRVLFLSGDRHVGAIYRETSGTPYPVYDITSSGITQHFSAAKEAGPNRITPLFGAENFGTIDIDWWAESVTLSLRGMNGEVVRQHRVTFAEITPKP